MTRKDHGVLTVLAIGLVSFMTTGCTRPGVNLVETGAVTVNRAPAANVGFTWVDVYQDNETLVVCGKVVPRFVTGGPIEGHVDIAVLDASGSLLKEVRTDTLSIGRARIGGGSTGHRFESRLPLVAPPGTTVRASFHGGAHETSS